jgi:NADPH2:quinone reductase
MQFDVLADDGAMLSSAEGLFKALKDGVIKANIAKTFPLSEAADAHRFIEARKTTGAIVLIP